MLSSIKPKLDIPVFANFSVFTRSYLFWAENYFEEQNNTIFCSKQVRTAKNTEINKQ